MKKPHCFRLGTVALYEIHCYQNSPSNVLFVKSLKTSRYVWAPTEQWQRAPQPQPRTPISTTTCHHMTHWYVFFLSFTSFFCPNEQLYILGVHYLLHTTTSCSLDSSHPTMMKWVQDASVSRAPSTCLIYIFNIILLCYTMLYSYSCIYTIKFVVFLLEWHGYKWD